MSSIVNASYNIGFFIFPGPVNSCQFTVVFVVGRNVDSFVGPSKARRKFL